MKDEFDHRDLSDVGANYGLSKLNRQDLHENPIAQFEIWFEEACAAHIPEPNAMSLATVPADGRPSLRAVLLKYYDLQGFVFFTNLESVKAREIGENPHVALLFLWPQLERQIVIGGDAQKISNKESVRYFLRRPRESQIGAWVSRQSKVISSRKLLEMKFDEMKRKFSKGQVPLPSFWGGYRVQPTRIEFWQGRPHRLHDRFLYTLGEREDWSIERLAP